MSTDIEPVAAGMPPALPATGTDGAGAGLFDHTARDPFPRHLTAIAGFSSLVVALGVAIVLWVMNPAFASGTASGTGDQIGKLPSTGGASTAAPVVAPGSPEADGKVLIGKKGCGGCHTIPGLESAHGTIGPNLAGVASRTKIAGGAVPNTGPDDLKKWIENPPALKPGTQMPNLGLSDDEATKIVAYLELLK